MAREAYHKALKHLEDEVLQMGNMVADAIRKSVEALKKRDTNASGEIVKNDLLINKKRFDIEEKCISLIATQQPMAVDLRELASILSIITDLERMGDHAEGIAKINILLGKEPLVKPLIDIPRMADIGLSMLDTCLKAFLQRDIEMARLVCSEDDQVDALHDQIYRELLLLMMENPKIIHMATYLIWVSHNLERIADRVTNIAERIVFMVTGKMEEINVSKY
ncbi:MAG: phosphate signaling complex protein PhoU [Candidatus Brocadia sp.]|jgi:phosphate uptake regulator, PhoU|uniref:Phosphate-specific transport system accessory protein PhoU n=1 Tax=Candidatus Brocadia fulgida TaxID=380242 RepID=A0A0M2UQW1_9BACT|nr:MAG: phosphate uptake regulator [Candidatus Brocadia fulgida]MCC6326738.1 phosphate signaling complex protein PhoU [Candidatus Brocadia sp.]MCE7912888.1 phosphate transport system regulatory protein PhoU [Candidatus Brocadia sp. AMX3]OQZ02003.1 MAG: phosphate transport system regulatory protein PhoU [Candidatus Brocadia sp. UTAMX2]MBV6518502.1 Phosphate-specific transport system accessory protein PhoU [Candidatus Brocadia fulgida]